MGKEVSVPFSSRGPYGDIEPKPCSCKMKIEPHVVCFAGSLQVESRCMSPIWSHKERARRKRKVELSF